MNNVNKLFVIGLSLCAGLGGALYGYDIGVISGALLFIKHSIQLSREQLEIIVGAVLFGSLAGTMITGSLADRFGRRTMILLACVVFAVGVGLILLANSFATLLLSRLLLGVGVGIVSVAVPLYLSETVPANWRGRSVSMFQIFLTLGILLAYVFDYVFTLMHNWRAMFAVILVPAAILFVGMLLLPETPRWLLSKNKHDKAEKTLRRIHGGANVQDEVQAIQDSFKSVSDSWKVLFNRKFILPLCVALFVAVSNQLTGVNVILQYAPMVMDKAGLQSHASSMLATIGIGSVQFIFTLISMSLIDVIGRRRLLIIGTLGIVIVDIYLACCTHFISANQTQAMLTLAGLLFYILFYAIGPGVVVWLVISELLPTKVRGKSVALCLFVNSLTGALLASVFLSIVKSFGMAETYALFGFCTFLYFLVTYYYLPETKGKSLEAIQAQYQAKGESIFNTAQQGES